MVHSQVIEFVDAVAGLAFASAVVTAGLTRVALAHRSEVGARGLALSMGGMTVWLAAYGIALAFETVVPPVVAYNFVILAAGIGTVGWFLMALEYTRQRFPSRRTLVALFAIPAATQVFAWTNRTHELFWAPGTTPLPGGGLDRVYGPLFYPHAAYSYLLVAAATALFFRHTLRRRGVFRRQAGAMALAGVGPLLADIGHVTLSILGPRVDLTPLSFVFGGLVAAWALFRYRFLELVPVARRTAVERMRDPFIALDDEARVIDANSRASVLLGTEPALGNPIAEYWPAVERALPEDPEESRTVELVARENGDDGTRTTRNYSLNVSPLPLGPARTGWVVVARDVTEHRRRECELATKNQELERTTAQLRRKNDQLERLADIIAHDLRTPVATAEALVELLRADIDDPNLSVQQSLSDLETVHARIREFSDQIPDLARESTAVESETPFDLTAIAEDAWTVVDTGPLSLVVEETTTLRGQPSRVQQALENLFENAAVHGVEPFGSADPRATRPGSADRSARPRPEDAGGPSESATDGQARSEPLLRGGSDGPDFDRDSDSESASGSDRDPDSETDRKADESATTVRVGTLDDDAGFFVEDDGPGIPPERRERALAYGTEDDEGGYGLAIVRTTVEAHGWRLSVTESDEGGARFEVRTGE
ncbi:PAS domain-containing protein [Halosimplex rubrum]|uniref:histidine kinase n=1 Tax=Halosimplex rubrum TaxID=869889 RepID=A0A7D5TKU5_9EURY|nr:histidine kinase N-terminal 7TM domain-containing protein [Halosimplex rubrum]QLH76932.1 PAS domain-containing protein [Halosimplex rubrum]